MLNYTVISNFYDFLFLELADPRTNNWFLIRHPGPGLLIIALYLYFVISWGPKFMENRKALKLNSIIIVYNAIQVIISTYIFVQGLRVAWLDYSWRCEPVDHSNNPIALKVAGLVHLYFMNKMTELLDTVFFVLRKKNNQISFLHIYHHTVMPMISWGVTKYYPGGHGTFIGLINSFVHIIMYSYYLLAAMGPQYQKYLWWKRYITTMQLAQFCFAFLHSSQLLFIDCGYPKFSLYFTLPHSIFFYYLFADFYKMAYGDKETNKTLVQKDDSGILKNSDKSNLSKSDQNGWNGTESHIKSQ